MLRAPLTIARLLTLALVAALACSCAARRQEIAPSVKSVSFEEDKRYFRWWRGTSDYNLRSAMEQQTSTTGAYVFGWVPRTPLDLDTLAADAWRVELWYAHHGFFDAEFDGWEVRTVRPPRRGHQAVVRVIGHVTEGEESLVNEIRFEGLAGPAGTAVLREIQAQSPLQVGDRFDLEAYKETEELLRQKLRERSYARARVSARAEARPEQRQVDVVYTAELGPPCRFGEVVVEGFQQVPELIIMDNVAIETGKSYKTSAMVETQRNLFGLGVFSLVQVSPDLSGEGDVIPVRVQVSESRFRQLKVGPGIGFQNGEQIYRARVGFDNSNLGRRLLGLESRAEFGYKTFTDFNLAAPDLSELEPDTEAPPGGPFVILEGALDWPRVFNVRRLSFRQELSTSFDREPGYEYVLVSAVPSFSYRLPIPDYNITLTQSFHAELWWLTFEEGFEDEDFCEALSEAECRQYKLLYLQQRLTWDQRDDPLFTRRGYYLQGSLAEAGFLNPVEALRGFSYLRGDVDMRRYFAFRKPFGSVLAGRIGAGAALPRGAGDVAYVPLDERFYLGGASTIRGWSRNYLGPRTCIDGSGATEDCSDPPEADPDNPSDPDATISIVPTGALAAFWSSLEWRIDAPYDVTVAVFTDLGMAWDTVDTIDFTRLQPSVGTGFRYATPIGPLRLDVAWRLRDDPEFVLDNRFAVHFALSEAF